MSSPHILFTSLLTIICSSLVHGEAPPIRVSADGGVFKTVQAAIDSIPSGNVERRVILIAPGAYKELIRVPRGKAKLTFRGESSDPAKTILTYDLYANFIPPGTTQPIGTSGTASTVIEADDFVAENLTFANSAGEKG